MKRFFLLLAAMRLGFFTEGRYSHWSSLPSAASQVSSAVFSTSRGAWKRTRILSRSFGPLSTQRVTRRSLVAPDLLTSRSTCRSSSSRTCCSSRWRFMISRPDCAAAGIAPAARSTIERRATTAPGDVTRPPSEQIAEHGEEAIVVPPAAPESVRSEEHTSELQSQSNLVCRLLLEKKKDTHREHWYKTNGVQR